MKVIGLFGGTFDPVHAGHLAVIRAAGAALKLDELRVLPAGDPWQKAARQIAPSNDRVAMLKLALADIGGVILDTRELRRTGPTYTADTLTELRSELGLDCALVWIIGSDAIARVSTWHRANELPLLAHFAVVTRRGGGARSTAFDAPECVHRRAHGCTVALPIDAPEVSSTQIRAKTARGASIRGLTPDAVCDYIHAHSLYLETT
ncbi:MAG: nicotinate (nicotinamide) nucleotide adenylyltransferase [Betaproteobacteria bacterium]|nr:nicotinate (nicotinamide) nucleotide adenylyltransferase [Betaproteobacteria bacterium]